jgi:acyl-CoA synthetase (AMP-forming)/AMP-acid ligase II
MLANLLETAVAMDPSRVVFRTDGGPVTIAELAERARRLAIQIQADKAGHCVYIGVNGPAVPLALFACAYAGVPFSPINYRLSNEQIVGLVQRLSRPFVVTDEPRPAAAVTHAMRVVTPHDLWVASAELTEDQALDAVDAEAVATVLFTSGTTAEPKAVPLRHRNLSSYILNSIELMGAEPSEATLVSVPPYHVAGVGSALTNVLSGRRIVYLPNFDPALWLETVEREGVTSAMVVPTMLARIVDLLGGRTFTSPTLRNLAYGGARISPDLLARALAAFPEVGFTNAYGLTETSSTLTVLTPEDHRAAVAPNATERERARLGSVGRPIPGVELQIRTADGSVAGPGVPGELWVRSAQISGEYLGQGSALDADGWFCTRDGGYLDEDGYLYITGRVDDTIIRGAENIAPAEIEDVLTAHPAVREAAVVGMPDPEWGERIVAAVVAEPGMTDAEELRAWVRARLRSSRTPDEVRFVDTLPYGPTGKLLRRELVARLSINTNTAEEETR